MVYEGGDEFGAAMAGDEEVPPVATTASAAAQFTLNANGTLSYELRAVTPIQNATASHIHLGARTQNGPVVLFLFGPSSGQSFQAGELIARGTVNDANVIARPGFTPTLANLLERMRKHAQEQRLERLPGSVQADVGGGRGWEEPPKRVQRFCADDRLVHAV